MAKAAKAPSRKTRTMMVSDHAIDRLRDRSLAEHHHLNHDQLGDLLDWYVDASWKDGHMEEIIDRSGRRPMPSKLVDLSPYNLGDAPLVALVRAPNKPSEFDRAVVTVVTHEMRDRSLADGIWTRPSRAMSSLEGMRERVKEYEAEKAKRTAEPKPQPPAGTRRVVPVPPNRRGIDPEPETPSSRIRSADAPPAIVRPEVVAAAPPAPPASPAAPPEADLSQGFRYLVRWKVTTNGDGIPDRDRELPAEVLQQFLIRCAGEAIPGSIKVYELRQVRIRLSLEIG